MQHRAAAKPRTPSATTRLALVAAVAALALVALPAVAAHATLESSIPAAGSRLTEPPTQVTVRFTERVDAAGTLVRVVGLTGVAVDDGRMTVSDDRFTVTVGIKDGMGAGAYSIQWKTLSSTDGHSISGSVGFAVGNFAPPDSSGSDTNIVNWESALGRALAFLGFAFVAGGLVFLGFFKPAPDEDTARKAVRVGTMLHVLGLVLLLHVTFASNVGALRAQLPAGSSTMDLLQAFLAADVARILSMRLVLALGAVVIAALSVARPSRMGPWAAGALLAGSALGSARLGHGSLGGPSVVAMDFLHLLATVAWAGGLVVFLRTAATHRNDPAQLARLGRRFGTLAVASLVVVFATGILLSLDILDGPRWLEITGSAWGAALAIKVVLALGMAVLGGINRFVLLEDPRTTGWKGALQRVAAKLTAGRAKPLTAGGAPLTFRRLLAVEASFGLIVLVAAGLLTAVSPPPDVQAANLTHQSAAGDAFNATMDVYGDVVAGGSSELEFAITEQASNQALTNATDCGRPTCVQVTVAIGANSPESFDATWHEDHWSINVLWTAQGEADVRVRMSSGDVFEDYADFVLVVK